MILRFDCLEILGLTQTCEFWGDNINFRNVRSYSARGLLSGSLTQDSIAPTWSGLYNLANYVTGQCEFYYDAGFLGSGRLTNLSFVEGTDVQNKQYSLGFDILRSGDTTNLVGSTFSGLSGAVSFFPYLNAFTESYEAQQNTTSTTDYSRNLSFSLDRAYGNQVTGAYALAETILATLTDIGAYTPTPPLYFSQTSGMARSVNQSIDTINGNFSFSENYSAQSGVPWVHEYTHSLNYGEDGIANISEQGSIQSNVRAGGTGARIDTALIGWNFVKTGIFPRVSGVFGRWKDQFQTSGCSLDTIPDSKNFTKDYPRGLVSYNYAYSNNPASQSGYYNSYEQNITMGDDGWRAVAVNGQLAYKSSLGVGINDLHFYYTDIIKPQISGYANRAYTGSVNFFKSANCLSGYNGNLSFLSSDETYNFEPASIGYNFAYSDDPSYIAAGPFKRIKNQISNQEITPLVNVFRIPNYLELPQNSFQANLGVLSNSIEIVGTDAVTIDQYRAAASGRLVIPTGENWMSAHTYSLNPMNNQFSMNVEYTYVGYRAINDFTL